MDFAMDDDAAALWRERMSGQTEAQRCSGSGADEGIAHQCLKHPNALARVPEYELQRKLGFRLRWSRQPKGTLLAQVRPPKDPRRRKERELFGELWRLEPH